MFYSSVRKGQQKHDLSEYQDLQSSVGTGQH